MIYLVLTLVVISLCQTIWIIINSWFNRKKDNTMNIDEEKIPFYKKIENYFMFFGFLAVGIAVSTPFLIMNRGDFKFTVKDFGKLGTVGDFFGGTTVGLLSLASLLLVTAAMMMQKKELELQRKEVKATRKEYEITNRTMKKQSFDSTFFNMIHLHQSILSQVRIMEDDGRKAFEEMYRKFKSFFESKKSSMIDEVINNEFYSEQKRLELIEDTFIAADKQKNEKIKDEVYKYIYIEKSSDIYMHYDLYREEANESFYILKSLVDNFEDNKKIITKENNWWIFQFLGDRGLLGKENINLKELEAEILKNPPEYYKRKLYEEFYVKHENVIGHYYRNLYRTVKYIQEYDFSSSGEDNERLNSKEQKEYRGILRAQLSSYELLMLFYNICYSEKGEKFKALLESTNFFDNHLVEEDFIWENDKEELNSFKIL